MLKTTGLSLTALALALSVACGGTQSPVDDTMTSGPDRDTAASIAPHRHIVTQGEQVAMPEALWPLNRGDSVQSLMEGDAIVVGRILSVALPYDPRPGYLGWTPSACPFDPDHPKFLVCSWTPSPEEVLRPPGNPYTTYAVEVIRALGSSASSGDTIFVRQGGGVWDGVDQHLEGDRLFRLGQTYLLTLEPLPGLATEKTASTGPEFWADVPFSRFIVDGNGKLGPLDQMWASMPAVNALTGRTPEDALAAVQAALATGAP